MITENIKIDYGKHNGELFTRLPVSYLRWMINEKADMWQYAKAEIERRGHKLPEIELSAHAINNASLRALEFYLKDRKQDEGLHTWLERITLETIESNNDYENRKLAYKKLLLVVEKGEEFPVLKTVIYVGNKNETFNMDF